MPQAAKNTGSTTSTVDGKGRVTVQLPADTAAALDRIGKLMSDSLFTTARVRIDISRPDVVRSLAATYEAIQAEAAAEVAKDAAAASEPDQD